MRSDDLALTCLRGDGRHAFRILRVLTPSEDEWRSNYERRLAPRNAELGSALTHMALSMYESADHARQTAERFNRNLGDFIAEVELRGDYGIWFAETGPIGHYSVWGRTFDLQRALVAVDAV